MSVRPIADIVADLRAVLFQTPLDITRQTALGEAADRLAELDAENEQLRRDLTEAQLRSIEARNPGINMNTVRRAWAARGGYASSGRTVDSLAPPPKGPAPGAQVKP